MCQNDGNEPEHDLGEELTGIATQFHDDLNSKHSLFFNFCLKRNQQLKKIMFVCSYTAKHMTIMSFLAALSLLLSISDGL